MRVHGKDSTALIPDSPSPFIYKKMQETFAMFRFVIHENQAKVLVQNSQIQPSIDNLS